MAFVISQYRRRNTYPIGDLHWRHRKCIENLYRNYLKVRLRRSGQIRTGCMCLNSVTTWRCVMHYCRQSWSINLNAFSNKLNIERKVSEDVTCELQIWDQQGKVQTLFQTRIARNDTLWGGTAPKWPACRSIPHPPPLSEFRPSVLHECVWSRAVYRSEQRTSMSFYALLRQVTGKIWSRGISTLETRIPEVFYAASRITGWREMR